MSEDIFSRNGKPLYVMRLFFTPPGLARQFSVTVAAYATDKPAAIKMGGDWLEAKLTERPERVLSWPADDNDLEFVTGEDCEIIEESPAAIQSTDGAADGQNGTAG